MTYAALAPHPLADPVGAFNGDAAVCARCTRLSGSTLDPGDIERKRSARETRRERRKRYGTAARARVEALGVRLGWAAALKRATWRAVHRYYRSRRRVDVETTIVVGGRLTRPTGLIPGSLLMLSLSLSFIIHLHLPLFHSSTPRNNDKRDKRRRSVAITSDFH